jgi:hypothetical protein
VLAPVQDIVEYCKSIPQIPVPWLGWSDRALAVCSRS